MGGNDSASRGVQKAQEAIVDAIDDKLAFNVRAYGKAWTGEYCDSEFIADGAAEKAIAAYVEGRSFAELVADVRTLLDTTYPADVFVGKAPDADPGARFVAKLREALAVLA
jgi:hypothetical protein